MINEILLCSYSEITLENVRDIAAIIGIILTLIFGVYTVIQKKYDQRLTKRNKLTDILEKLANLNMDDAKTRSAIDAPKSGLPINYSGLVSDYRRFYVTHAADFANGLPNDMIYSHELSLIAQAFDSIDDYDNAKIFFKKSIKRAKNNVEGILSNRSYARFVFRRIDIAEGEKLFEDILEKYKEEIDTILYYRGETYMRLAQLYKNNNDVTNFEIKLKLAIKEFSKMKSETQKQKNINKVNSLLNLA